MPRKYKLLEIAEWKKFFGFDVNTSTTVKHYSEILVYPFEIVNFNDYNDAKFWINDFKIVNEKRRRRFK